MLIATYFKRPNAPVNLPNADGTTTDYFFRPVHPGNPQSEHVAEVTDPAHIQRLLAITEGYYPANAEAALEAAAKSATAVSVALSKPVAPSPQAAAPAPATPPPDAPPPDAPPPPAAAPGADKPALDDGVVAALLALSPSKFKAELEGADRAVLARALEIETAKGPDERATYTKALRAAIG